MRTRIATARARAGMGKLTIRAARPKVDAKPSMASGDAADNCVYIGVSGADWRLAAPAVEADAPAYVHFLPYERSMAASGA